MQKCINFDGEVWIMKVLDFFNLKMFISIHDLFIVSISKCILPSARCDFKKLFLEKTPEIPAKL